MSAIQLRPARLDDMAKVFRWRNAPEVRAASFTDAEIAWPAHENWFRQTLANASCHLLIGECEDEPVGVIRFDVAAKEGEISIYLVSGGSGRGVGTALLRAATAWVARHLPGLRRIVARVRPQNIASQKAFEKAGFCRKDKGLWVWVVPDNMCAE